MTNDHIERTRFLVKNQSIRSLRGFICFPENTHVLFDGIYYKVIEVVVNLDTNNVDHFLVKDKDLND